MADAPGAAGWRIIGQSVIGAAHIRNGLPNQDAIGWQPQPAPPFSLVVSDGHGGNRNFRSDTGSRLAVETALGVSQEFIKGNSGGTLSAAKRAAEERLPQQLSRRWEEAVRAHLAAQPYSDAELKILLKKDAVPNLLPSDFNPLVGYGATQLIVLVCDDFILYVQLGDGDIVTVSASGTATRPLPPDERLFANETTSLCAPAAWKDFRVRFQPVIDEKPALIVVSTDGYSNSFLDDAGFMKVGPDIATLIRTDGIETVDTSLRDWLSEASKSGSGDDVTIGCICNMALLGPAGAAEKG